MKHLLLTCIREIVNTSAQSEVRVRTDFGQNNNNNNQREKSPPDHPLNCSTAAVLTVLPLYACPARCLFVPSAGYFFFLIAPRIAAHCRCPRLGRTGGKRRTEIQRKRSIKSIKY